MWHDMTNEEIDQQMETVENNFKVVMKMKPDSYESIVKKQKMLKQLREHIDSLVCVLEVEHFLENGPQGQDPV